MSQERYVGDIPITAWLHSRSGKAHVRPECQAVYFHRAYLELVTLQPADIERLHNEGLLCGYCFRTYKPDADRMVSANTL